MTRLADELQVFAEKTVPTGTAEAVSDGTIAAPSERTKKAAMVGVMVQAPSTNTASVFVGPNGVTAANGLEVQPGRALTLPVSDETKIFCIAGVASQKLRILKAV